MTLTMRLLAALWHDADDVAFVRACVRDRDDDQARDAWRRMIESGDAWLDPATHAGRRTKAYAPLVLAALDRHGIDPGHQPRATLRAWRLHEQLRLEQYREILRRVLRALADETSSPAAAPILLKGLALADTVYPHPLLRHSHDIDLLVAPDVLPRVAAALEARDFAVRGLNTLMDPSGLPVVLHTHAGVMPAATIRVEIDGQPVMALDPAHALVHVCLRGLLRNRGPASLRWMVDAWYLIASELSWDRVIACVREHRAGLPVAAAMTVMSARLGAPVPPRQLDALIADAARAPRAERARLVASFTKSFAASYVRRRLMRTPSPPSPSSTG